MIYRKIFDIQLKHHVHFCDKSLLRNIQAESLTKKLSAFATKADNKSNVSVKQWLDIFEQEKINQINFL